MKKIEADKSMLDNGLKIITSYRDSDIFSMAVGVKVGSLYEDESNNGISHMIEHMLFKGTSSRNVEVLNDDIERLAGNFDVYTTYHQTVLSVDVMKDKAEDSFEIMSDMLMRAVFPEKEFRLEKKVIIEEIKMSKDDAEDASYLGLYKAAFPKEHYKYHIAGTIKSVKSIKIEMVKQFYEDYYRPNNTVICVVSSYTHEEIVEMVRKYFDRWERRECQNLVETKHEFVPQRVLRSKTGMAQTHLLYGFDIQELEKREQVALTLLNEKIGAGANSVLFRELRDRKGYAYNVYSDVDFIPNLKMFYIYAGISEENLKDTIEIIDGVIASCRENSLGLDENGLKLIKQRFLTDTTIALESSSHIVDYILDGELDYGNPLIYQEFLQIMDEIDVNDIRNVISKVFKEPITHILSPK